MKDILVLKFGGSVLQGGEGISKAASVVLRCLEKGYGVCVVVSALKGVTDELLSLSKKINPNTPPDLLDEVLSMGERTSARLFADALMAKGVDAKFIDPDSEDWPLITDGRHLNANPILEETRELARRKLLPLIEGGKVPIICGFVGKSRDGKITTLGRGGSDTTAVVLGNALDAKEVVLLKDVGIFSSDPDKVRDPIPISELDSEEALMLSSGGAEFLHAKALAYKKEGMRIRIASLDEYAKGTVIEGGSMRLRIEVERGPITMATIVGASGEGMERLIEKVREEGGKIHSLTMDPKAVILYLSGGKGLMDLIHRESVKKGHGKAVSFFEGLCSVTVKGSSLETSPGMIQRVTQPLAREGINVYGLITISSSIRLFVRREELDKVLKLLKEALPFEIDLNRKG